MRNLICVLASALVLTGTLVGCGGATNDIIPAIFTATQMGDLIDNGEETLDAQQLLAKWSFEVARGDISVASYDYDPPTAANGWKGTVTATGASFPFGDGDLTMVFTATGDGGPAGYVSLRSDPGCRGKRRVSAAHQSVDGHTE